MKRLKFAYARGARIQVPEGAVQWNKNPNNGPWVTVEHPYWSDRQSFRVHPDDAHLEYGPLSSQMLKWAKAPKFSTVGLNVSTEWHAAKHFWLAARFPTDIDGGAPESYDFTEEDCRMLALFLAEMLADEGL